MKNPFAIDYPDIEDKELIQLGLNGDKKALQNLILRHQVFVYNLALKMSRNTEDAEDLTQEVFIKAITALSKFKYKSSFRTWLYRITVNHFLNTKKRPSELVISDFEHYFQSIEAMPSYDLNEQEKEEWGDTIEEIRIRCTAGMLLCLSREQRMIYILGEMFEVDHKLGAEILEISPGNFRVKLTRVRKDLYNWMNKKCGLINKENPCRCSKKTKAYIKSGKVDPNHLKFNSQYRLKIGELSKKKAKDITNTVETLHKKIFQDHPLQNPKQTSKIMDEVFNNDLIKFILNL
ncbi:RNA polymerase sigma factor [Spongiimicrobium salis]|uniref:RNA polymerase sigma factor n=1 Tax=Spongiimicrobium salis TaxID=1667022 RepID=UPI00374CF5FB